MSQLTKYLIADILCSDRWLEWCGIMESVVEGFLYILKHKLSSLRIVISVISRKLILLSSCVSMVKDIVGETSLERSRTS